jgi:hypothetical protein
MVETYAKQSVRITPLPIVFQSLQARLKITWNKILTFLRMKFCGVRPVVRHRPRNNETTAVVMQHRCKHASTTIELQFETVFCNPLLGRCNSCAITVETDVFSSDPCRGVILKAPGTTQLVVSQLKVEFCTGDYDKRTWARVAEE